MDYQIVLLKNNERIETVSSHSTIETTRKKFNALVEENKEIDFPVEYINKETILPIRFHLAIIKRKSGDINEKYRVQNDLGQYVDVNVIDNDEWLIYDRVPYKFEETFWVYGYNPRIDRKTFKFILEDIYFPMCETKTVIVNLKIYKNKLLLESFNEWNLIICKNNYDANRLLNLLFEKSLEKGIKNAVFTGDITRNIRMNRETRDKIMELTHWDKRKVNRCTT